MLQFSFNFPHHGRYSSYHHQLDFLSNGDTKLDASLPPFCYSRWFNIRGVPVREWLKFMEGLAWNMARRENQSWLHYLYPEHTYFARGNESRANTRILLSCHLPANIVLRERTWLAPFIEGLKRADGVIIMSPDVQDFYAECAPRAAVRFIPHGVDIEYFKPLTGCATAKNERLTVLTVGNMLRDFQRLAEVIKRVHEVGEKRIVFKVIALKANLDILRKSTGESAFELVHAVSGISDKALLACYHEADLMFLPLLGATANNALLEAMATGLPLLISDFSACRAYAGDSAIYFQSDEDAISLADRILRFEQGSSDLARCSSSGRNRAVEHFSWEQVLKLQAKYIVDIELGQFD